MKLKQAICKIKNSVKIGNLHYKFICVFLMLLGYSNMELQQLEVRNKVYKYIRRKYDKKCKDYIKNFQEKEKNTTNSNYVWVCWLQGIENAPVLVRKCIQSIYNNLQDTNNLICISEKNMFQYIDLPDYIVQKWNNGIISNAHFTDIVRLELLDRYGGTWIDATVYMTGKIPQIMYEKDLFLYVMDRPGDITLSCNNWFIISKKNNKFIKTTKYLLLEYWKNENKVREYFIWHLFATLTSKNMPEQWNEMYKITDNNAHILQKNCNKKFDEKYWNYIKAMTPIHKLTYKQENCKQGTYLSKLLNENL